MMSEVLAFLLPCDHEWIMAIEIQIKMSLVATIIIPKFKETSFICLFTF